MTCKELLIVENSGRTERLSLKSQRMRLAQLEAGNPSVLTSSCAHCSSLHFEMKRKMSPILYKLNIVISHLSTDSHILSKRLGAGLKTG